MAQDIDEQAPSWYCKCVRGRESAVNPLNQQGNTLPHEGDFIMYQVTKRDGQVVDFEISKISDAITKAFVAIEKQYHPTIIDLIALHVTSDFEPKIREPRLTSCTADSVRKSVTSVPLFLTTRTW